MLAGGIFLINLSKTTTTIVIADIRLVAKTTEFFRSSPTAMKSHEASEKIIKAFHKKSFPGFSDFNFFKQHKNQLFSPYNIFAHRLQMVSSPKRTPEILYNDLTRHLKGTKNYKPYKKPSVDISASINKDL